MNEEIDPFVLLRPAATGDIEAQRALAEEALRQVACEEAASPFVTMAEGILFARLAASHGDTADIGRLISMLALAQALTDDEGTRNELAGEAIALVAIAAESGAEMAERTLEECVASATPEAAELALEFQRRMKLEDQAK